MRTRRNVPVGAALRGDDHAIADIAVPGNANLAGENDVLADHGRSGQSHLRAQQRVLADRRAMSDLHQVVDLGAARDAGLADAGAIDAGVGLHFDIALQCTVGPDCVIFSQ